MSDFGNLKKIITRKLHTCLFCLRKIPVKTEAFNYKGMFEGDWQNNYSCAFCQTNDDITKDEAEGISGDEFITWVYENDFSQCPDCKKRYGEVSYVWNSDSTILEFECDCCGKKWNHFIGFNALEVDV